MSFKVHTLASLSSSGALTPPDSPLIVPNGSGARIEQALVTAATLTHEQKVGEEPKALLKLGGVTMLNHVLIGLCEAGLKRVVVLVADSARVQPLVDEGRALFPQLAVEFLELGADYNDSHASSIVRAQALFDQPFLLVPSDHLYETKLYQRMTTASLADSDAACLVETDLEGMVGLPKTTVHVAFRPLDDDHRISHIGWDLDSYNGIDAGLIATTPALFTAINAINRPYVTVADALAQFCAKTRLKYISTRGATWFSVETDASTEYSTTNLTKVGQRFNLEDGKVVHLLGHPKRIQTSPSTGGDWSEFSVNKWRSAVFTTKSFFNDLYEDTTAFINKYLAHLGADQSCLIEVGCGTGESLIPHYDVARYCIGVDVNQVFVDFCKKQTTEKYAKKVGFACGDAEFLESMLLDANFGSFLNDTKKLVTCVGNTIGIIPDPKKTAIYRAMLKLAGPDGVVVVVYWNGNCFGEAVQHFYHKNPQLCGTFDGSAIDLVNCSLTTPSGYSTKWTTPAEAETIIKGLGAEVLEIKEQGRGVLVAFRATA